MDEGASQQAEVPVARPTLAYATPAGLNEVPDVVPAVEAAIDEGASIRALVRQFATPYAAESYLRRSLARRGDFDSVGPYCESCGTETRAAIRVAWTFAVPKGLPFVTGRAARTHASTLHACCERCAAWLMTRDARLARTRRSCEIVANVGGGLFLLTGLGIGVRDWTLGKPPRGRDPHEAWIVLSGLLALALLAGGWLTGLAVKAYARGSAPRLMRRRFPRWLRFESFDGVAERGERMVPLPIEHGPFYK